MARPITPESPPKASGAEIAPASGNTFVPSTFHGPTGHQHKNSPLGQPAFTAEAQIPSDLARVPARKPLGPRSQVETSTTANSHLHNRPQSRPNGVNTATPNPWVQEAGTGTRHSADSPTNYASTPDLMTTPSFTLNLIRRNRSSGGQWNVARISCQGDQLSWTTDSVPARRSPSPSKQGPAPAIDISVENSGYAKFRNIPLPSVVEAGPAAIMEALAERDSGRSSGHSSNLSLPVAGDTIGAETMNGSVFSRQVTMGYTKSWTASVKEKLQKLEVEARARTGHVRGDSATSRESFSQRSTPAEADTQGMRQVGYAFTSPWNGRCEFRTGNGGRTLRCTHALDSGAANGASSSEVSLVSELRFNLPASEMIPGGAPPRDPQQLLSHFGRVLRSRARSDPYGYQDDDDDDDTRPPRFDLSLGKERAGGGRRGNRSKMGKLIITSEGLKMLDLVVAANIGVWWKTWEKSF